jgi:SAM-dependent methyltransferase
VNDVVTAATAPDKLFARELPRRDGVWLASEAPDGSANEIHTNEAFSEKWMTLEQDPEDTEGWKRVQLRFYLNCYGYESEEEFASFLRTRRVILDGGCGPGYKAAWFARLAPHALVVAMDRTDSAYLAAKRYAHLPNLVAVKGDISDTPFRDGAFDFISCDQVLHHTDSPPDTVKEFARILSQDGQLNTYVYARKALPRQLLDDHLLDYAKQLSKDEIWALSGQLTELGKTLSELNIQIDVPDMPALGIKGGRQDLQRFLYWNFLKCYWNEEAGFDASKMINFDWYAPSTAFRYSRDEFVELLAGAGFRPEFLHSEEACHTGRFTR